MDFLFWILIIFAGHRIVNSNAARHGLNAKHKNTLIQLFYWHMLIGLAYASYAKGTDASFYWNGFGNRGFVGETWFSFYGISTTFMFFLNFPFSQVLGLSYWTGSLLYSLVGYVGFVYLFLIIKENFPANIRLFGYALFPLILFLPNLHFWSSGVGKDSLSFFCIAGFFYALTAPNKRVLLLMFTFILLYHVRPHMALIMVVGGGAALLFSGDLKPLQKAFAIVVLVIGSFFIYDRVFTFLGIDDPSNLEAFEEKAEFYSHHLGTSRVGSAVDISSYSFPMRLFTYLYRPLFFDAHNFATLLSSFENFFYLLLTFTAIYKGNIINAFKKSPMVIKAGLFSFVMAALAFSNSLSNLGIIMRMKNMTMIYFLLFLFFAMSLKVFETRVKREKRR
jgi:hypothetical protein